LAMRANMGPARAAARLAPWCSHCTAVRAAPAEVGGSCGWSSWSGVVADAEKRPCGKAQVTNYPVTAGATGPRGCGRGLELGRVR